MHALKTDHAKTIERTTALTFIDTGSYEPIAQALAYKQNPEGKHRPGNRARGKDIDTNPYRILLAEDDKEMRTLLARALHSAGYVVVECPDGWDLLAHLGSHLLPGEGHEDIDLIISDIRMPGVTGMDVLRDMRKSKGFPPMILITAFGDDKTHARAEQLEAAAIFDKPFDIDELLARVHKILNG